MYVGQALELFQRHLRLFGRSEETIYGYRSDLERCQRYLESTYNLPWAVELTTAKDVHDYLLYLSDQGLSPVTINRHLDCLRSFFQCLWVHRVIEKVPTVAIPRLKVEKREMYYLDLDTSQKFISGIEPHVIRTAARTLFYTGVRISELVNLQRDHVDLSRERMLVFGKGRRERVIPIHRTELLPFLAEYADSLKKGSNKSGPFFQLSKTGGLSASTVTRVFHDTSQKLHVKPDVTPHVMRHSFATHFLDSGGHIGELMRLMGHDNLSTTGQYLHANLRRVQVTINNM